jgi:hypothetical protein
MLGLKIAFNIRKENTLLYGISSTAFQSNMLLQTVQWNMQGGI